MPDDRRRTRRFAPTARSASDRSAPQVPPLAAAGRRDRSGVSRADRARPADRRALRHFRLDERVHAAVPAFPACARRNAARLDLPVRHAADQRHAGACARAIPTRRSRNAAALAVDWSGGTRIGEAAAPVQPRLVAARARPGRDRAAVHRRARARRRRATRPRDGAAAQIVPAADLGQPAAAFRRILGEGAGHSRDAAACRRVPADPQSRQHGRTLPRAGGRPRQRGRIRRHGSKRPPDARLRTCVATCAARERNVSTWRSQGGPDEQAGKAL